MNERVIAGEKPGGKAPLLPKVVIAAALSACVLIEGGCVAPKHPECAVYFRGDDARTCENVRCKLTEARKELRQLGDKEKVAASALRAKIAAGKECREELDKFNLIHAEMKRISKKLDGYSQLEMRIRDGDAEEGEIRMAFEEIISILGKITESEQALVEISRNI